MREWPNRSVVKMSENEHEFKDESRWGYDCEYFCKRWSGHESEYKFERVRFLEIDKFRKLAFQGSYTALEFFSSKIDSPALTGLFLFFFFKGEILLIPISPQLFSLIPYQSYFQIKRPGASTFFYKKFVTRIFHLRKYERGKRKGVIKTSLFVLTKSIESAG